MRILAAIFIFLTVFVIHSRSVMIVSTDSMWSIYLAKSFITQGDLVLDEYKELAKQRQKYGLRLRKGELYSYFPVGTALMAVPFVWGYEKVPELVASIFPVFKNKQGEAYTRAEDVNMALQRSIASFFVAMTCVLLFFISLSVLKIGNRRSLLLALLLSLLAGFATPLWSTASRGLWQHGPSALLISASLLFLINLKKHPNLAGFLGLFLAYAYFVRPTNAGIFLVALFLMFFQGRRQLTLYCIGAGIVFVPFVAFSFDYLNRIVPPYYSASRVKFGQHFPIALMANLVSPNRGLLLMSPFLIVGFVKMLEACWQLAKNFLSFASPLKDFFDKNRVDIFVCAGFFANLLSVSLFPEWWGGHAFGARYMTETVPYLIYFSAKAFSVISLSRAYTFIFMLLSLLSVFIHYKGANCQNTFLWNTRPTNIDRNPNKTWDFYDLQFLR